MAGDAAGRVGIDRIDRVSTAGRTMRVEVVLEVVLHVSAGRRGGVVLLVFQRPLLLGGINLAEIVDAAVLLGRIARPDEVGDGDGGQQADDGHNDHDFDERKARLA